VNICLAASGLHDLQVDIKRGGLGLGLTIPHFCDCPKAGPICVCHFCVQGFVRGMVHVVVVGYIVDHYILFSL